MVRREPAALLVVAAALALGACATSHAPTDPTAAPASRPRYLALGDSFTIGTGGTPDQSFPARLAARWACGADVENLGVNGYTTDDLIAVELPRASTFAPGFVTVLIGANDIVRGQTPDVYRAHLRLVFQTLAAGGPPRVVALPQPDWSLSPAASAFGAPAEIHARIVTFNAILREEATAARAEYFDLFPLMEEEAKRGMLASDGLHPSADAYAAWAEAIASGVASPCGGVGG